jgi:hypothetical protein
MWIRLFLLNNKYIYIYNCSDRVYITTYGGLTSHGYTDECNFNCTPKHTALVKRQNKMRGVAPSPSR